MYSVHCNQYKVANCEILYFWQEQAFSPLLSDPNSVFYELLAFWTSAVFSYWEKNTKLRDWLHFRARVKGGGLTYVVQIRVMYFW